jgi:hypothetical protein
METCWVRRKQHQKGVEVRAHRVMLSWRIIYVLQYLSMQLIAATDPGFGARDDAERETVGFR